MKDAVFAAMIRNDEEWTYDLLLVNNTEHALTFSGETGMYEEDLVSGVAEVEEETLQPFSYTSLERGNRNVLDFTIWYKLYFNQKAYRFFTCKIREDTDLPVLNQRGQLLALQEIKDEI